MKKWRFLLLLCFLLAAISARAEEGRAVAVTFDDLPFVAGPADDAATLRTLTASLLESLAGNGVPVVGFVNEAKLYREGRLDEARVALLEGWLDAGQELGNHTFSHLSLNKVPLDAFKDNLVRGEAVTRALMEKRGMKLRYFRPPFLHLGPPETRSAFERFLAERGYTVAPVTLNSAEWIFAAAYAKAEQQGDREAMRRVVEAYLPYMEKVFALAERLSVDLFGYEIRQVLLLHANSLNAAYFGELATLMKKRGYAFITLEAALQDKAYRSLDTYSEPEGESWLERWARTVGLRPGRQPPVPAFVMQLAGPAAYQGY